MPSALNSWNATPLSWPVHGKNMLGTDDAAHLLIEVDGFVPEDLMPQCERILPVLESHGAGEILFAEIPAAEKDALWFAPPCRRGRESRKHVQRRRHCGAARGTPGVAP